jgi:hypothetical protein
MICPACYQEIKIIKGACSHCGIAVERLSWSEGNQRKYGVALADDKSVYTIDGEAVSGSASPGGNMVLMNTLDSNPRVYLVANGIRDTFQLEFRGVIPRGFIYCPNCHSKLFQNITASSSSMQHHRCNRCKCDIRLIFQPILVNKYG